VFHIHECLRILPGSDSNSDSYSDIDNEDEYEYDDNNGIVKEVTPEDMDVLEENTSASDKSFLAG
jgi:hypothetical protein